MRKLLTFAVAVLFCAVLVLPPAGAINWTFKDNVVVQGAGGINTTNIITKSPYVDVRAYGASSSAAAAVNDAAILASTTALSGAGVISFPAGIFSVSDNIYLLHRSGVRFKGAGPHATILQATSALAGKSVFKFTNCEYISVEDMSIYGVASPNSPLAAIQSHVQSPVSVTPQGLKVKNVQISSSISNTFTYGIYFSSAYNNNNDQAIIEDVVIAYVGTGIAIGHQNSLWHRIIGGLIAYCGIGISTDVAGDVGGQKGGSFFSFGTNFLGNGIDVDIGPSVNHPIGLFGTRSEAGTGQWIRMTGSYKVMLNIYGATYHGAAGGDGIKYSGSGTVNITASDVVLTAGGTSTRSCVFDNELSNVIMQGNVIDASGTGNGVRYAGKMVSIGNSGWIDWTSTGPVNMLSEVGNSRLQIYGRDSTRLNVSTIQQVGVFSTSFTPSLDNGTSIVLTLTNNTTINNIITSLEYAHNGSSYYIHPGTSIEFIFIQNNVGGHTVTFGGSNYVSSWSNTGNTANKISTISFVYNGTKWIQRGAQSPYM